MPPKRKKAKKPKATMSQNVKQSVVVHVNTSTRRQPTRSGNRSQPMSRIQTPQFVGVVGQDYSTYNNQLNNITQAIANAIKQPDRTGNLITTPPRQAPDEPTHTAPSVVNIETQPAASVDAVRLARLSKVQSPASPLSDKSSSYTPSSPPPNLAPQPNEESKVKASSPIKSLNENVDELSGRDSRRAEEPVRSGSKGGRKPYTEEQKKEAELKKKQKMAEQKQAKAEAKAAAKARQEEEKADFVKKRKEAIEKKEQEAKEKAKKGQKSVLTYFK